MYLFGTLNQNDKSSFDPGPRDGHFVFQSKVAFDNGFRMIRNVVLIFT